MNATFKGILGAGVLVFAATLPAGAQIVTDRPDFTESTVTVPDGRFQIEAGYTYLSLGEFTTHQIGEALLRYGLIPGLELRAELPSFYSMSGEVGGPLDLEVDESGIGDAGLGMKLGLYEAGMAEGIPSVSILLGTSVPTGDDDFGSDGWEPEAVLALGWEFAPRLELGANVGYAQRALGDDDNFDEFLASIALAAPFTSRLGGFVEYFAIRPDLDGADEDYIDGGVTFLVTPDFQLDARIGFGVGDTEDAMFFGVGLGKLF